ncbi:zinc finger and BTB domain-containing protein 10-like isoform X1 [Oncorhynchus keta]|uniref:zinc finger and BTB domain-containing protein 10-like isoform X1 n=1 Tax=Oncorhynchus keta TaxID=8018 RepID=UPI00227AF880|nr:zinc finger and BTB domain-containing protein 10-like isoform X1 [Oncorhynchus keta]
MSGERNRRSLAFRGGGLAVTSSSGVGGGNSNSWEAQACQDRHLNGNRPDQEEDRDLGAKGPSQGRVEGGGSLSDSAEPEAEEEEDPEGGNWAAGVGDDRIGWVAVTVGEDESREGSSRTAGNCLNNEDGADLGSGGTRSEDDRGEAARKSWVEMRPQTLLQKHPQFQASWLQEFPWLTFCQETGLMSCSWCHNIPTKNNDELVRGSRNYKRALLLRHHLSSEHGRNDPTKQQELERPGCEDPPQGTDMETEDYYSNNKPNQDSYCYQLLQELDKQRKGGILCDVNIVVSGEVFRAHKNILVAGSRYFKTLYCLTKSENSSSSSSPSDQTTTVTVTHLDVAAGAGFSVILDFLYSGNLLLTSQNAIEVMSMASFLQMTEVVGSCRGFIKEALNISMKQEAPDSVVVDYNKRRTVAKDGAGQLGSDGSTNKKPGCNFWATSILSKLSIKASGHVNNGDQIGGGSVKEEPSDVMVSAGEGCALGSSGWGCENSSESAENEPPSVPGPVFVWNEPAPGAAAGGPVAVKRENQKADLGSGRRKKQITRRFVYNIPPESEEGFDEGMFVQPSASYPREDFSFLSENAELANQFQYSLLQESQQGESWENGESSDTALNKLKCPHCNYIAKHRRTLKRHLIIHSGVRSFSCDICGKLFTRREHVKRHSLVHKKDKKYKCMVCKKIFMLAASVGIRHGSRRYGVCVDCAESHQSTQEGLESLEVFVREDDDFEGEEPDEDMAEEGEEPNDNDQSNLEGDTGS